MKTTHLHIRVHASDKAAWEAQAKKEGLTLTEWITRCANDEINWLARVSRHAAQAAALQQGGE